MFDIRTLVAAAALSGAVLGWPAGVALNGLDQDTGTDGSTVSEIGAAATTLMAGISATGVD